MLRAKSDSARVCSLNIFSGVTAASSPQKYSIIVAPIRDRYDNNNIVIYYNDIKQYKS